VREFQLKRNPIFFGISLVLTLGSASVGAQSNGTFRATEPPRSRQGVERRPQPVVVVTQPGNYYQPGYYPGAVYPVAYTTIPAVLMSDGSIWANFGYGYEPVTRACVVQTAPSSQPVVVAGNGMVISGGSTTMSTTTTTMSTTTTTSTVNYMPPAPAQQSASYYNLPSVARQRSAAGQAACFSRDANGQFFIVR
jgi:hypothetical protein